MATPAFASAFCLQLFFLTPSLLLAPAVGHLLLIPFVLSQTGHSRTRRARSRRNAAAPAPRQQALPIPIYHAKVPLVNKKSARQSVE